MESAPQIEESKTRGRGFAWIFLAALTGLVLGILIGGELAHDGGYWEAVTRHSDRPTDVMNALNELERELATKENFYIVEIEKTKARATWKAEQSRKGIGEPGEKIDEKRRGELQALAPEWDAVAARANEILMRRATRGQ